MLDKLTPLPDSSVRSFSTLKSSAFRFALLLTLTVVAGLGLASCDFINIKDGRFTIWLEDTIHFTFATTNTSYNPPLKGLYGVLIDGSKDGQCLNDYIQVVDSDQDMKIGDFTGLCPVGAVGAVGEIIGFTKGHPPTILDLTWTTSYDYVNFRYQEQYAFPVKVWIVSGNKEDQRKAADLALAMTEKIWHDERQGFAFLRNSIDIDDQHQDQTLLNFDCTMAERLVSSGRWNMNVINIYYVDKVIDENGVYSHGQGINCGAAGRLDFKNVIVLSSGTSPTLLAHELGHSFGLDHIADLPGFGLTNVMHEASIVRQYLTEGQTFRQAIQTDSAINSIYAGYLGGGGFIGITLPPPRVCFPNTGADWESDRFVSPADGTIDIAAYEQNARACPLLQTRIWPDGRPFFVRDTANVVWWSLKAH